MLDTLTASIAQEVGLAKRFNTLGIPTIKNQVMACKISGDGHTSDQCPNTEAVQYVGSYNMQNNPFSNTYNLGWRNHPNLSWNNQGTSNTAKPNYRPEFQPQVRPMTVPEKKPSLEDMFIQYMSRTNLVIQCQAASLRTLETQISQLTNVLKNRPQGALPSDTKPKSNER
ncbi:DNA-directed DNA polymerase [Quillaja saponaria]|uniref:DNA-directed DNA polymerase n=1 Tax=Quillaja saponaria TaxID=32244 RepID=A0AAD7L323_QUISA|nr:DNA-directed DNA polymerase [Quillaja saponaria]